MIQQISVRDLAAFVHRRGDLHARLDGRARAEEGIRVQQRLQKDRPASYECERPVHTCVEHAGITVHVAGRVDGCDLSGRTWLVEEFKTTRAAPDLAHAHHGSAHWAQARLYGALLAAAQDFTGQVRVRLLYCHPDTLAVVPFERKESAGALVEFLAETLTTYGRWLEAQQAHRAQRNAFLAGLDFPYPQYRPFQRAMARRAYQALRDREHLLLEAPTGSGKTAAVLFPALRALEASGYQRVIFLTSRGTGAAAARDALARMDPHSRSVRHVSITARDKACFVPGTPCEPEACPYARGYWDRARDAVQALLGLGAGDPGAIADVAREHEVCPYELSVDAAPWSDVVIGDYNYLLDPVVRLQRLAAASDSAVLVDESHQLSPRVRDMLSLSLSRDAVRRALDESPPDPVAKRLQSIDRQLRKLAKAAASGPSADAENAIDRPDGLFRALQRFVDELAAAELALDRWPAARALLFDAGRWLRADAWYDEGRFVFSVMQGQRELVVRLSCLDPGPWIRERLSEFGGHVRFSGTVSPLALYQRLHGLESAAAERAGNPFAAEQLEVLVVPDVPTFLRVRQRSLPALLRLVRDVHANAPGHCLVAFPSFDYLQLFAAAMREQHPEVPLHEQAQGMTELERANYLHRFHDGDPPVVGLLVLGGVFGESVDFPGARLAAVVCVGVGLPPPSLLRSRLADYFDAVAGADATSDGTTVAYHQPAMVKVLQMAGRLLRGPEDRGVLCLVDGRFRDPAYARFFPSHWRPQEIRARDVGHCVARFWRAPAGTPSVRDFPAEFP